MGITFRSRAVVLQVYSSDQDGDEGLHREAPLGCCLQVKRSDQDGEKSFIEKLHWDGYNVQIKSCLLLQV